MKIKWSNWLYHPLHALFFKEARSLRLGWAYKMFVPPALLVIVGLLLITRTIRLPSGWALKILIIGPLLLVYCNLWRRIWRSAQRDKAFIDVHRRYANETMPDIWGRFERSHEAAMRIISQSQEAHQPFALFLRNFAIEGYDWLIMNGPGQKGGTIMNTSSRPGKLEEILAARLAGRLPIIGVANQSFFLPPMEETLPKLILPGTDWQGHLENLIMSASIIVVDLEEFSEGVGFEIEMIRTHKKEHVTVIVLPDRIVTDLQDDQVRLKRSAAQAMRADTGPDLPSPGKTDSRLSDFRRIIYEDEMSGASLDDLPAFADLLRVIDRIMAMNPEQRGKRARAYQLHSEAMASVSQARLDEAIQMLNESVSLKREVEDMAGLIVGYQWLGALHRNKDENDEAGNYYRQALHLARELKDDEKIGRLLQLIGENCFAVGETDQAISHLRRAAEMQTQIGHVEDLINTLGYLAKVYEQTHAFEQAAHCYGEMGNLLRRENQTGALSEILRKAGEAYVFAGKGNEAIPLLKESRLLSQERKDQSAEIMALAYLAILFHRMKEQQQADDYYQQLITLLEQLGDASFAASIRALLDQEFSPE